MGDTTGLNTTGPDTTGPDTTGPEANLHIDCDTCQVRGLACHDCMVTVLLGPPPELGFDEDEQRALGALAGVGLIPPLRMVMSVTGPHVESA